MVIISGIIWGDSGQGLSPIKPLDTRTIITLLAPVSGKIWEVGKTKNIIWTSSNVVNIKIEYSTNNGSSWTSIISDTIASIGNYNWVIPNTPSNQCKIKISSLSDTSVNSVSSTFSIVNLTGNLIAAYNFSGNTLDASGNNFTAVPHNKIESVTDRFGRDSSAVLLDGSSSYLSLPRFTNFSNIGDFTISLWINLKAFNKIRRSTFLDLRGDGVNSGSGTYVAIDSISSSQNELHNGLNYSSNSFTEYKTALTTSQTGNWVHHVFQRTGNQLKAYLNNVLVTNTFTSTSTAPQNVPINFSYGGRIGTASTDDGTGNNFTSGIIDDISIYDKALTENEISALYNEKGITLLCANDGKDFIIGWNRDINWECFNVQNVRIEYSPNNGSTWSPIINSFDAAKKTYAWLVPNTATTQGRIRIVDADNPTVGDTSKASFTIRERSVKVLAPVSGEYLNVGSDYAIKWSATATVSVVNIKYRTEGITSSIAEKVNASDTVYHWTVPNSPSNNVQMIIQNVADTNDYDISYPFTIFKFNVVAPNGGENLGMGNTFKIKWDNKETGKVNIDFSKDNGKTWLQVIKGTKKDLGEYVWTVSGNSASDSCLVRITDSADVKKLDISDSTFKILSNTNITVIAPNGGERLEAGKVAVIQWSTTDDITSVKLEYTTNNGTNWLTIKDSVQNSKSYSWTVPYTASLNCRVRISNVTNVATFDFSDAVFEIFVTPTIIVTQPNGGENWQVYETDTIKWTSFFVTNIKIEYTTDNGTNWQNIIASTPASSGTYAWTVPNTPSKACKVRITDVTTAAVIDQSDSAFTISPIIVQNGLVGYYPFNGNANDESGNGNNGTNIGTTLIEDRFGKSNSASNFNGQNQYMTLPNSNVLNFGANDFTISYWENRKSTGSGKAILARDNKVMTPYLLGIADPDSIRMYASSDAATWNIANNKSMGKLKTNEWVFYTVTRAGSKFTTYQNGGVIATFTSSLTIPSVSSPLYVGYVQNQFWYQGDIDELRIYNRALNQTEIDSLYHEKEDIPASLTLTSPNGGEQWQTGSTHSITWAQSKIDTVVISYSTNQGTGWIPIAETPANSGTYSWVVPSTISSSCKVKVSDKSNSSLADSSNSYFTITSAPVLQVLVISPNGGENWKVGDVDTLKWTSLDITNVKVEYTSDNGSNWTTVIASTPASSGSYVWTVPNTTSANCRVKISDVAGNVADESDATFIIFTYPASITVSKSITFGDVKDVTNYVMIGLPGNKQTELKNTLTGSAPNDWNAYWDNGASQDYKVAYNGSAIFNFQPGRAFWVLSKNGITLSDVANSVPLGSNNVYSISLHSGWNLISNPFEKNVSWATVKALNEVTQPLYTFNKGYSTTNTFEPYKGYYFYNTPPGLSTLKIPYNPTGTVLAKIMKQQIVLRNLLTVSLLASGEEKSSVEVQFEPYAKTGYDSLDIFAPPGDFEKYSVTIYNPALSTDYKYLNADHRNFNDDGDNISLKIKNTSNKEIMLRVLGTDYFNEKEVYLLDKRLSKFYNLKEKNEVILPGLHEKNDFNLLVGSKQFIEQLQAELLPKEYYLYQNYPNPFNPNTFIRFALPATSHVTITIYSPLGERIEEITNTVYEAGYYELSWSAFKYASGVYFYSMEARSADGKKKQLLTQKMQLIK